MKKSLEDKIEKILRKMLKRQVTNESERKFHLGTDQKDYLDNRGIERVHMCWENGRETDMKRQSILPKTNIKYKS